MHSPLPDLSALVDQFKACKADVLISVGGGSAIDAAKGASLLLASGGDLDRYAIDYASAGMKVLISRQELIASTISRE